MSRPIGRWPRKFPPPALPRQAEAFDWAPPPWANRPAAEPPSDPGSIDYVVEYCDPAFSAYIGKAPEDSDLDYDWLVLTDDAWRSGNRTVQCAAYDPNISRLTRSLRGTRQ